MNSGGKVLSVVIPIYNEVNIEPNITRVLDVLSNAEIKYEIILVDDGSRNNAWGEISDIVDKYEGIIGIAFAPDWTRQQAIVPFVLTPICSFLLRLYRICISCGRKGMRSLKVLKRSVRKKALCTNYVPEPFILF